MKCYLSNNEYPWFVPDFNERVFIFFPFRIPLATGFPHGTVFFPWDVFYLYVQESNGGFCQSITAMITYLLFWVHLCGVLTCMCQFKYIELFWHPWDDINFNMINCFFMFLNLVFNFHCKICASTFTSSTVLPRDFVESLSGISSISLSMEFGPVEILFLKESYCPDFF